MCSQESCSFTNVCNRFNASRKYFKVNLDGTYEQYIAEKHAPNTYRRAQSTDTVAEPQEIYKPQEVQSDISRSNSASTIYLDAPRVHMIKYGDTLQSISKEYGVQVSRI